MRATHGNKYRQSSLRPWVARTSRAMTGELGIKKGTNERAKVGGAKRDRTADLLHAMQALSQLSYGPMPFGIYRKQETRCENQTA
jgi:hypothetical protein